MTTAESTPAVQSTKPALSVVMPVHNARPYLDQAVESILKQTFGDFEFVILDDASTDGSRQRLREWANVEPRIRLIEAGRNLGPVGSSNMVARAARAPFVARMDADDISLPDRLKEQLQLLEADAGVGIIASVCDIIDSAGVRIRGPEIWRLLRRSAFVPFAHGAMMYRRDVFDRVDGYRQECEYWEDQDLVIRMAAVAKIVVMKRTLYSVRQSATGTRALCAQERLERALQGVYNATDQLELSKDGTQNLRALGPSEKLDPRVFIALGSLQLWAGGRPRLFSRLLGRARMSFDARTASALVWTAWATASPSSLRSFLKFLLRLRNKAASIRLPQSDTLLWAPMEIARPYSPSSRGRTMLGP